MHIDKLDNEGLALAMLRYNLNGMNVHISKQSRANHLQPVSIQITHSGTEIDSGVRVLVNARSLSLRRMLRLFLLNRRDEEPAGAVGAVGAAGAAGAADSDGVDGWGSSWLEEAPSITEYSPNELLLLFFLVSLDRDTSVSACFRKVAPLVCALVFLGLPGNPDSGRVGAS